MEGLDGDLWAKDEMVGEMVREFVVVKWDNVGGGERMGR
jgi:hypothetical protein